MLEAAVVVFHQQGYAATAVSDLAAALGILKGSLYYYIDSKEDLLFKIVSEVHQAGLEIIEDALDRPQLNALERLAVYVRNQTLYNATHVRSVAVYYRDVEHLSTLRLEEIRGRQASHFHALVALIVEAQSDGLLAQGLSPTLAAHGVCGTMIWPYTWYGSAGHVDAAELADFSVNYVLRGLSARDVPAAAL